MTDRQGDEGAVVIGLDLGTTSVKALAVTADGTAAGRAEQGYPLVSRPDGAATQDVDTVVAAARTVLEHLKTQLGDRPVRALVPSAAMHSVVLLDRSDHALAGALTWADARPATTLPGLRAQLDPAATYAATGCPLQTPYHPARLWWLRAVAPEVLARARRVGSLTDVVLLRLCGVWATSVGLASTTGLWHRERGEWDAELLKITGVSAAQLPTIHDAREGVGHIQAGPLQGVPVLAGSSDGACAALGSGARVGDTVLTVGTSGAVRRLGGAAHLDPQARTWSYRLDLQTHLIGGAINNGGLLLDWVRRGWYPELTTGDGFAQLLADAGRVPAGADGLTLLPYLSGERSPIWRSDVSATVHGLRLHHTRAEVARAALEAIAFSLAQLWALTADPHAADQKAAAWSTGGLARDAGWNTLLASVLGVPLRADEAADASALGAALNGWPAETLERLRSRAGEGPLTEPDSAQQGPLQDAQARWQDLYRRLYGEGR